MAISLNKTIRSLLVKLQQTSLSFRYGLIASALAVILLVSAVAATVYIQNINARNAADLQLQQTITSRLRKFRAALWQAGSALDDELVSPMQDNSELIESQLQKASRELQALMQVDELSDTGLLPLLQQLERQLATLQTHVTRLLQKRQDPNWVYPMLPFINQILLESNQEFYTAVNEALAEVDELPPGPENWRLYRLLDHIKDLWQLKILEFRAVVIRFAALGDLSEIPQEENIDFLHEQIEKGLARLEKLRQQGKLGFVAEQSLDVMKYRAGKWFRDFQAFRELRRTGIWRSDLHYLQTNIRPSQELLNHSLAGLEDRLAAWSTQNTRAVEQAASQLTMEIWGLALVASLFMLLVYFFIDRSVLSPLARIAGIISSEGRNIEYLSLDRQGGREIDALVGAFNNLRKLIHQRQMALEYQALHDALTGLPNRTLLQDRLEQAIHLAHRQHSGMALLLLDLDRFKEINDTLGHPVGDRVLREIGKRLDRCMRETDTVARLGGDEFAIIAPDTGSDEAIAFAERIIEAIDQVINIDQQVLYVGASIGIALYPQHGIDAASLIRHADVAMYRAKRNRENHIVYDDTLDKHNIDNLALLGDLRRELAHPDSDLQLYYQPQIKLFSQEVIAMEALLRWKHPLQGFVSPELIVRMAEQTGMIGELTDWVLNRALADCAAWQQNGVQVDVAVNLSALDLQDMNFPASLQGLLDKHQLPAACLSLEITENAMMSDPVRAREVMSQLNKMGTELVIDDYGTGFSSLAYLKMLPVQGLKIDKSFVIDMLRDENDSIIVHSTIELAHNLDLAVMAEGVEDQEAVAWLREQKCDYAQGFHIARPMPMKEFYEWYSERQNRGTSDE
jgi:diguanylate cyclase (GGDEF)-like protein